MPEALEDFVVAAKRSTYAGDGQPATPSRHGSHDLEYRSGDWCYRDSYFGGTDFLGQEVVWRAGEPVWAMNYHGFILRPDLIDARAAGRLIKAALSALYAEGRFLGGFSWSDGRFDYVDEAEGTCARFLGTERIFSHGEEAYRLHYHGGLIRE